MPRKLTFSFLPLILLTATPVLAAHHPYVFIGGGKLDIEWKHKDGIPGHRVFADDFNLAIFGLGYQWNPIIATELSVGITSDEHQHAVYGTDQNTELSFTKWNFDLVGQYPINPKQTLKVFGNVGAHFLDPHMSADYGAIGFTEYTGANSEFRGHIGLGLRWDFCDNMGLRLQGSFADAHLDDIAEAVDTWTLQFIYGF